MAGSEDERWPLFHDLHLYAKPETRLAALVDEAPGRVDLRLVSTLAKKPRKDAVERRRAVIGNILANLTVLVLTPGYEPGRPLAIATAKTREDRYTRSALTRSLFADVLEELSVASLIDKQPYVFKERLTTITPTPLLLNLLASGGFSLSNVGRYERGEAIVISVRSGEDGRYGEPVAKERIDYEDDANSRRLRKEMNRINAFINSACLDYDGKPVAPIFLRRSFLLRKKSDPVAFKLNGRLAGGFWMNLPGRDRHRITLNGEGLADLDYKGMFVQLAYRRQGLELAETFDPYAIPGLERHRDGAKLAMLSLLGRKRVLRRLSSKLKEALPDGTNASELVSAVKEHHNDIQSQFAKDIGVELMFLESQILVAVLLRLISKGIAALPMHDGIMVAQSRKTEARQVMKEASAELLGGAPLPVTEKEIRAPAR